MRHRNPKTQAAYLRAVLRFTRLFGRSPDLASSEDLRAFQLFQRQLRLIGSFGCTMRNIETSIEKLAVGLVKPIIDLEIPLEQISGGLERLENRQVFGKIIVTL